MRLGEVADVVSGVGFPKELQGQSEGEVPVFKVGDISNAVKSGTRYLRTSPNHLSKEAARRLAANLMPAGTTVFAKIGEGLKLNRRAVLAQPSLVDNNVMGLVPKIGVATSAYLYYFMQTVDLGALSQATAVPSVRKSDVVEISIPVPSVHRQSEIVAEIEKQFSRLDEAVANLQRVKANLKRHRASTLKAATDGTLIGDPGKSGWRDALIGEVGQVISGLTKNPKREALPRKMPYLRVANVYANELRLDQIEYIGVAEKEVEKLLVRRGDLLVVEGNGSPDQIGRVALWDSSIPDCVHQNHLIKVRLAAEVAPEWALIWLLSPGGRREIEQVSSSTAGLHTLSTGKISRLPIPVPPLDEQHRIVAEVDRRLSIVREVEAEVDANLKRAQALRQAVLARAFAGQAPQ